MKAKEIVLIAGAAVLAYQFLKRRAPAVKAAPASAGVAARLFGPSLGVFAPFTVEPNPVIDGTIVDNSLDLLFTPGAYYGGPLQ